MKKNSIPKVLILINFCLSVLVGFKSQAFEIENIQAQLFYGGDKNALISLGTKSSGFELRCNLYKPSGDSVEGLAEVQIEEEGANVLAFLKVQNEAVLIEDVLFQGRMVQHAIVTPKINGVFEKITCQKSIN